MVKDDHSKNEIQKFDDFWIAGGVSHPMGFLLKD